MTRATDPHERERNHGRARDAAKRADGPQKDARTERRGRAAERLVMCCPELEDSRSGKPDQHKRGRM